MLQLARDVLLRHIIRGRGLGCPVSPSCLASYLLTILPNELQTKGERVLRIAHKNVTVFLL